MQSRGKENRVTAAYALLACCAIANAVAQEPVAVTPSPENTLQQPVPSVADPMPTTSAQPAPGTIAQPLSATPLPATSVQQQDPLAAPPVPAALSATVTSQELTAQATTTADGSILELTVVNNGNRTLLVDADKGVVTEPKVPVLSRDQVIPPPPLQQVTSDFKEVALSIATIGIAGIVQDIDRHRRSPLYYGQDETRRTLAEKRFGPRILFPGDSTRGRVWLTNPVKPPVDLVLPVMLHPEGNAVGVLTVHVQGGPAPATTDGTRIRIKE